MTLLFAVTKVNAQAHNLKPGWCKYAKKVKGQARDESASAECQVCKKENEKEQIARAAEDKRRNDVVVAKAKADKIAKDAAYNKAQAELAEKNKVTEVAVTMPKSTVTKNATLNKKIGQQPNKSTRFMSGHAYNFFNENGDIKPSPDAPKLNIEKCLGTYKVDGKPVARYLHPAEIGVILYESRNEYCNGYGLRYFDIVDYDIKPFFSDKSMHHIEHFYGNWFVIGYLPCESYIQSNSGNSGRFTSLKLYNVVTRKFKNIEINESFSYLNLISCQYSSYHHGRGDLVFHNRFYESGEYKTESESGTKLANGSYELLIDKLTGGNDMWKAAICVRVSKSLNNYNYTIYLMSKNNEFTSFTVDATEFHKYYK